MLLVRGGQIESAFLHFNRYHKKAQYKLRILLKPCLHVFSGANESNLDNGEKISVRRRGHE